MLILVFCICLVYYNKVFLNFLFIYFFRFFSFDGPASLELPARSTGPDSSSQNLLGFAPSARVQELRKRLISFMERHIYPSENELNDLMYSNARWTIHPTEERLKKLAKSEGLWNLWIPVLLFVISFMLRR